MNFLIFNQVSYSVLCSKENTINKSISIQCRVINSNVNHKTYRISMLKFNQQFLIHISSFSEAVFILQKNNTGKLKRSIHEVFPNFCFGFFFHPGLFRSDFFNFQKFGIFIIYILLLLISTSCNGGLMVTHSLVLFLFENIFSLHY